MDPQTLQLVVFAEQLAALAAKAIVDLKNVLTGNTEKKVNEILDDADATYQSIITSARQS